MMNNTVQESIKKAIESLNNWDGTLKVMRIQDIPMSPQMAKIGNDILEIKTDSRLKENQFLMVDENDNILFDSEWNNGEVEK